MKDQLKKTISEEMGDLGKNLTVTILEGSAPQQHNSEPVLFSGTITAPRFFADSRKETFDPKKAQLNVNVSQGTIVLIVNERDKCNKSTITGKVIIGKKFSSLGINNNQKSYSPPELSKKFRLMRSIFTSHEDHMNIVSTLRNLEAKVNNEVSLNDDRKGNTSAIFKQTVESNMPDSFKLKIPLLEGEDPQEINVDVILESNGQSISCFLESVDAADTLEDAKIERIADEISKIDESIVVMYQ